MPSTPPPTTAQRSEEFGIGFVLSRNGTNRLAYACGPTHGDVIVRGQLQSFGEHSGHDPLAVDEPGQRQAPPHDGRRAQRLEQGVVPEWPNLSDKWRQPE